MMPELLEQPGQWRRAQSLARTDTGAGYGPFGGGALVERELAHGVPVRLVAEQAQPDDEPDHLLGEQATSAQRGRAGRLKGPLDPAGIDEGSKAVESCRGDLVAQRQFILDRRKKRVNKLRGLVSLALVPQSALN